MDIYEMFVQLTGVIGWLLLVYSYYKDDIDKLLFVQIISSIFYCINYFLLGAYSGLIVCFIELLKGIGYYKTDKDDLIFLCSMPVYLLMIIFSYDSFISLLPIIGSIIDGFSLTKNKDIATMGSIISNILWVLYDILIFAYAVAITDGILVISNISILVLGYSRLIKTNKLRIAPTRYFSKNLYKEMYKLDKKNFGDNYTWEYDYEKKLVEKNNKSLYLIKYNEDIVGYFNCYIINEEEYISIVSKEELIKEYNINNMVSLRKTKKNYLIIDSINIDSKYRNHIASDLIIKRLKKIIVSAYKDGYRIEKIISICVNDFEKEVLEKFGFTENKEYLNKEKLYVLDNPLIEEIYNKEKVKKDYYKYKVYVNDKINESMIREIQHLDNKFFKEEYLWDEEYQLDLFNINKNSMIMVKYENKLIGYLNYLVITEDKYREIINSDYIVDDFKLDEVTKFYKSKKNYITLNSVVIDKKFQDGYTVKLLTKHFKKMISKMNDNNYKIKGIVAVAVSKDGRKFLNNLKFKMVKELNDGNALYVIEN